MESLLLTLFHVAFVTAVYCAAYQQGIRAEKDRTRTLMEDFNTPLADLVEKLNRDLEKNVTLHSRNAQERPNDE